MTLFFVLQKKCKIVFDEERLERMKTELVGSTDLGVSSPVEEDGFRGRDTLSVAPPSAEGEMEPLVLLA